jgi:CHAD domain-containing protein
LAGSIRKGESEIESARRIVRGEAKKAQKRLTVRGSAADVAVHAARKRIKRARAALRLVRKPLGERRFRRENHALREAARPLARVRDAKIVVEALDALLDDAPRSSRAAFRRVRGVLIADQLRARRRTLGKQEALKPVLEALRSARKRSGQWPSGRRRWSGLGSSVRRVYRDGREAYASMRDAVSDEGLHEWRKQAKYLWHQLEMLEPMRPRQLRIQARQAQRLSRCLGDDHDLALLRDRLRRLRSRAPASAVTAISPVIDRKRRSLQARALTLGKQVYRTRPRLFVRRLARHWHSWRRRRGTPR